MSEDVVTEIEARRLLGAAAATIEVTTPAPMMLTGLPEPRRHRPHRRWSLLLAVAACVALVAGAAWVVARQVGEGRPVPPGPAKSPTSGEHRYDEDQVPALVGATVDEARALLTGSGRRGRVEDWTTCAVPAGVVVGTKPTAGTPVAAGAVVHVVTASRDAGDCPASRGTDAVWDLVRFARALDGPPAWAGPDPCGAGRCDVALATLAELASRPAPDADRTPVVLQLAEGYGDEDLRCLEWLPEPGPGLRRVLVHVGWQPDELVGLCPRPPVVQVDLDGAGRIAGLEVRGERGVTADLTMLPKVSPARHEAAERFVAWARTGANPPAFADRVRRLTGGFGPPWVDDPADRSMWSGCSGLGFPGCGIDPVANIYHSRGDLEVVSGLPPCPGAGLVDGRWADQADVVRLSAPGFACDDWFVLLWIDDGGVIRGVM